MASRYVLNDYTATIFEQVDELIRVFDVMPMTQTPEEVIRRVYPVASVGTSQLFDEVNRVVTEVLVDVCRDGLRLREEFGLFACFEDHGDLVSGEVKADTAF